MTPVPRVTRRGLLTTGTGVAVFGGLGARIGAAPSVAVPLGSDRARFLRPDELATLRALVDRVVPGTDEDTVPGAVTARCHQAIDSLLGAFTVDPPRIYAGAPFSDRGGSPVNHFQEFLPLDRYEETAWRLRIRGSRGRSRLERNGPVTGYQSTYRRGLAALEESVPGGFSNAPGPARDAALRSDDPAIRALVDLAVPHTVQFMYGAPEYGGNRDLVGWTTTDFEGDVQPRGYTDEQVTNPEPSSPTDLAEDLLGSPAVAMGSPELVHGVLAVAGDRWSALRAALRPVAQPAPDVRARLEALHRLADALVAARETE
jgi:Gluconate 2-dehydrogenase subunit 3